MHYLFKELLNLNYHQYFFLMPFFIWNLLYYVMNTAIKPVMWNLTIDRNALKITKQDKVLSY